MNMLIGRRMVSIVGAVGLILLAAACSSSTPPASSAGSAASASTATAASTSTAGSATSAPAPSATASAAAAAAAAVELKTESTKLGTVLVDKKGKTIYWFAKDTSTTSACTGACATAWPPVIGMPQAAAGSTLTGKFGTIRRSDGTVQATYEGHPLYTFEGDTAPGQTNGNGVIAFGAAWSVITISGG
ncbi:MAG: COG4315 family predicted lipoprotein [Streptosporangiaceae bacterium]